MFAVGAIFVACNPVNIFEGNTFSFSYDDCALYTVADRGEVPTVFSSLEVDWYNGAVVVEQSEESSQVEFFEISEGEKVTPATTMHYFLDGDTLRIKYAKSGRLSVGRLKKFLYVRIPVGFALSSIDLNSVSADVLAEDITVGRAECSSVSGSISLRCNASEVNADNVSGAVRIDTSAAAVNVDTVSGAITVFCRETLSTLGIDSVSGSIVLRIAESVGFSLKYDTVSGILVNAFSEKTDKQGNLYVYGDGGCSYGVTNVSGRLTIEECV